MSQQVSVSRFAKIAVRHVKVSATGNGITSTLKNDELTHVNAKESSEPRELSLLMKRLETVSLRPSTGSLLTTIAE